MRFSFFHLMPYGAVDLDAIVDTAWIKFSNSNYDPKEGHKLYNRYLDELEYAEFQIRQCRTGARQGQQHASRHRHGGLS